MPVQLLNGADFGGQRARNLGAPTAATDAATKSYVDLGAPSKGCRHYLAAASVSIPSQQVALVPLDTFSSDDPGYFTQSGTGITVVQPGNYACSFYANENPPNASTVMATSLFVSVNGTTIQEAGTQLSNGYGIRVAAFTFFRTTSPNMTVQLRAYFTSNGTVNGGSVKDTGLALVYLGT